MAEVEPTGQSAKQVINELKDKSHYPKAQVVQVKFDARLADLSLRV